MFSGATLSSSCIMMAVVRLKAKKDNTGWVATYIAGALIVSRMICWKVLREDRQILATGRSEEFSHSKCLQLSLVTSSRPRWQHAAASGCFGSWVVVVFFLSLTMTRSRRAKQP